jgi:hypothetical protein
MLSPATRLSLHCSIALATAAAACRTGSGAACAHDSDCPSHFCKLDHTCGIAPIDGPQPSDAPDDASNVGCVPNHDGTISAAEIPLAAGRTAKFRIATSATWNTAGQSSLDGSRTWDLSGALANDADQMLALSSPSGTWWRADFPTATYATPLAAGSDLLGVFAVGSASVTLLGVVSPTAGATKTELTYDPPAEILAIPMQAGSTWSSTSTVSGYAQGVLAAYTEAYTSRVDQVGTMMTPYGAFPVLRVATDLQRTSGAALLLSNRTFAWIAECFGPVATVRSADFETSAEFSSDAEVRRLAP